MLDVVAAEPAPRSRRAGLSLGLRMAVSAGLLALLWRRFPHVDARDLVPAWNPANVVLITGAMALFLASYLFGALRWQHMLRVLGIRAETGQVLRHTMAGQFLSVVLPGSVGGDVVRVGRMAGEVGDRSSIAASVGLERLTGWLVLPLFTVTGFALNSGLRDLGRATALALVVALATWGLLGALLLGAGHRATGHRYGGAARGWRRAVGTAHLGVDSLRREPAEGAEVFAAGIAHSLLQLGAVFLAARVVGIDQVGPTALLAFYPAVGILQVLPIAVGGLGVREGALALFLAPLGVPPERAAALGLLLYALTVASSLFGAPAFAMGMRSVHHRPRPRAEVVA